MVPTRVCQVLVSHGGRRSGWSSARRRCPAGCSPRSPSGPGRVPELPPEADRRLLKQLSTKAATSILGVAIIPAHSTVLSLRMAVAAHGDIHLRFPPRPPLPGTVIHPEHDRLCGPCIQPGGAVGKSVVARSISEFILHSCPPHCVLDQSRPSIGTHPR